MCVCGNAQKWDIPYPKILWCYGQGDDKAWGLMVFPKRSDNCPINLQGTNQANKTGGYIMFDHIRHVCINQ